MRPLISLVIASCPVLAPLAGAAELPLPVFVDIAGPAGIRFVHVGGSAEKPYIFEAKGGGVCLLDYDRDGVLDVFFVNGSTLEDLHKGVNHPHALYRARGDGTYADVTEQAGVEGHGWGMGCAVGDTCGRTTAGTCDASPKWQISSSMPGSF